MYPYLIAALLLVLDQFIKALVVRFLMPIDTMAILPGILNFTYSENRGVAFGMFSGGRILFILFTVAIVLGICWVLEKTKRNDLWFTVLLAVIMGGAAGNLVDRIRLGYVVDYIHFSFFPYIFNFADSCVVAGAILLGIAVVFFNRGEELLGEKVK